MIITFETSTLEKTYFKCKIDIDEIPMAGNIINIKFRGEEKYFFVNYTSCMASEDGKSKNINTCVSECRLISAEYIGIRADS